MKKLLKNILWTMFYIVFCPVYAVFESIKYIVTGKNIVGKIAIVASYAGVIALALIKPLVFWIVLGLIILLDFTAAIFMTKSGTSNKSNESGNGNEEYHSEQGNKVSFFDGLTVEEAKKEYRKLMKMYHPDNSNGDEEMSKKISAAYDQYRALYGN